MKILLACYTDSLGHAGRSSVLAKRLKASGAHVQVAGGGRFDAIFKEPVHPSPRVPYELLGAWLRCYLPGLPFTTYSPAISPEELRTRMHGEGIGLETLTAGWLALLDQLRPDFVVSDGRPELYWATGQRGIPLFGMMSFVWTERFCERFGWVEPDDNVIPQAPDAFNQVGTSMGLPPVADCWAPFRGRASLLPDAARFVGARSGDGFLALGPLVWNPQPEKARTDFGPGPLVYATTGSSQFPHLEQLAYRLAKAGVRVVLSGDLRSGSEDGTAGWNDVPPMADIIRWKGVAPGSALARAANLVLSHGGSQTLYQAAMAGTFSYVVPHHFDHRRNALMFQRFGLAETLREPESESAVASILKAIREGTPDVIWEPSPDADPTEIRQFLETA